MTSCLSQGKTLPHLRDLRSVKATWPLCASVAKTGMAVWESNYPWSVYRRWSFQTSLCMLFPATIHRAPS